MYVEDQVLHILVSNKLKNINYFIVMHFSVFFISRCTPVYLKTIQAQNQSNRLLSNLLLTLS